jgi:hypothetical protein
MTLTNQSTWVVSVLSPSAPSTSCRGVQLDSPSRTQLRETHLFDHFYKTWFVQCIRHPGSCSVVGATVWGCLAFCVT